MKKIEIYDRGRILPFLFLFGHEKVSSSVLESRIGVHEDGGIVCIYRSLRGKKTRNHVWWSIRCLKNLSIRCLKNFHNHVWLNVEKEKTGWRRSSNPIVTLFLIYLITATATLSLNIYKFTGESLTLVFFSCFIQLYFWKNLRFFLGF